MPFGVARTPEDEEFEEADAILSELRRKAETGEGDLPWGDCLDRTFGEDGTLRVTREYATSSDPSAPRLLIRELPYSAHPCSGVGGTGGVVWPGALTLADLLRERKELLEGTEVMLEIGAGCGLAGFCAASLLAEMPPSSSGDRRVILTDGPEAVMENLEHNVENNRDRLGSSVCLQAAKLMWEELLDGTVPPPVEAVDLLLGSDVIWGGRGPMVGQVARRLVKPGGWLAISAQKGREGLNDFEAVLRGSWDRKTMSGPNFDVEVKETISGTEAFQLFICHRQLS
eukprot:gb/GFBE01013741.1/.p1 GENE.gb/GFBE01013741.1/~~gb/GFBE01013741.1/.p1  ORF type:complete len:285 (+),score=72.27 gb/GFBE01013741.1/:1-855(+)